MKIIILAAVAVCFVFVGNAQEIGVFGGVQYSSSKRFNKGYGGGLAFNFFVKNKSRLGLSVSHYSFKKDYDDIFTALDSRTRKYYEEVDPNNTMLSFKLNYAYSIVAKEKASLKIGPELGLNYFSVDESMAIRKGEFEPYNCRDEEDKNNKLLFGSFFEFVIDGIFIDKVSVFIAGHYAVNFYQVGVVGSPDGWFVNSSRYILGLRYRFAQKE